MGSTGRATDQNVRRGEAMLAGSNEREVRLANKNEQKTEFWQLKKQNKEKMMKHRTLTLGINALVMFIAVSVNAATIYYDDETLFLSAISCPSMEIESFETLTATNTQNNADVVTDQVTVIPGPSTILGIWDDPINGPHSTDGFNFIRANTTSDSASTTVTFFFDTPINAFGINITDFGDINSGGGLLFTNDVGDSHTVASGTYTNGNELFFGLTNDSSNFQSVTFFNGNLVDGTGYDEIYSCSVPIPGAIWLLGSGLAGVAGLKRKKKK